MKVFGDRVQLTESDTTIRDELQQDLMTKKTKEVRYS